MAEVVDYDATMRKIGGPLILLLAACNDPATKDSEVKCRPIPGESCETGGEETDQSDTESGGEETDGEPTMLGPGECVFNPNENEVGLQYNCFGELHTNLDLTITGLYPTCEDLLGDAYCSEDHLFDYDANVVACCGEYDIELKPAYQQGCIYDLYQQVCISLAERLEYLVQEGEFGAYANKGAELQQYVAENYDVCFDSLLGNNVAPLPYVETHWALEDDFGLLADIVLHIEADTRVDGVNAPDFDEEWPTCNGAGYNNTTVFGADGQLPIGEIVVGVDLLGPVNAELSGPSIFGGEIAATLDFGTTCSVLGCPEATFSHEVDGDRFGLEGFVLIGGAFEILVGDFVLYADHVRIQLYSQSLGRRIADPVTGAPLGYEIAAGDASFLVAGASGNTANRFLAPNASPIRITPKTRGVWAIGPFMLEYEDGNHERWTLMLEGSEWR